MACLILFPIACTENPPLTTEQNITVNQSVAETTQSAPLPTPTTTPTPTVVAPVVSLPAKFTQLPESILAKLQTLRLPAEGISIYIQAVDQVSPLLAVNEDVPRNPASVMKVITTYAGLGILGADYRWPIELYTTGTITGDTLQGDLILKGYGDPNFKEPDLRHLLEQLRAKGIWKISGNLIIDNSYFSVVAHDPGEFDGKRYAAYNAQADALLYNEGVSEFIVRGHEVIVPNPALNVTVNNGLKARNASCHTRMGLNHRENEVNISFEGSGSTRCGERRYALVITDAINMMYATVSKMWISDMGGDIHGADFVTTATPATAQLLAKVESEPLSEVLPMINKKSNNVMAQQLFLSIGAKQIAGAGDTTEKSYQAIQTWFKSRGLFFEELQMENGSGLSRHGRVSAKHIAQLLLDAYQHPQREVFIDSLPIMGVDGTLRKRMRGTHVAGHAHLKTGTLNNAKALAGYVTTDNGETYVVAILHNDPSAKYKAPPVHDAIIDWVANLPPKATESN
jgi:D-alanyl-D-alanine carboxypeptidase/D-alanyl-D-alanine-endopeptidase (penicillin-binding protein 4)